MAKQEVKINVKPVKIGTIKVRVIGRTPYMPEPMDIAVLERYNLKKANKNFDKDTLTEEEKARVKYYFTEDEKKGIPSRSFYMAMIRASSYIFGKSEGGMRNAKEGIVIEDKILPMQYKQEKQVTHWGRMSGQSRAPRKIIRNSFEDWSVEFEVQFNQNQLSAEQILTILNWAGFHIGVGAFRKEKTGNYGLFYVEFL